MPERMQGSRLEWWRRHGWTVAILLAAIGISFAIRTIWTYPIIAQWGPLFTYAGGSDSYYHSRVTSYIILNHQNLVYDPLIHFPVGGYNPREPLFDWMNAILGLIFAPAFGGNAVVAGAWFLTFQGPFWAALGVVPVYLIGREVSSRRMGLIAAVIFPFLSANIDSSIFGYANYLSFYTFIILVTVYAYIRTVKAVGSRRWIANYWERDQYVPGFRAFWQNEQTAIKWSVFTGVSLGALALAWQGYTYAIVVIGISLVVAMFIERIRRIDSFGLYFTTAIIGAVAFPMAVPYYIVQHQFSAWFDLPLLLFFGTLALMLPFLLMRDLPWVVSIPTVVGLVGLAAVFLYFVEPRYFSSIITGQGYFVKNLIYSTVAEAQAPSIDQLVVGYGVVTFFLAFVGVALFIVALIRQRFKRQHIVFLVFAILSIYLPISAAKFFLLGSPAFALLPAEALERALDAGGYPTLRRSVASLSDRGSQFAAFRKSFKVRHVLIFLLVVGIVLPNVWVGIDAGIPGNTKDQFSQQVYDTLPSWLRGNASTANNYFGAAGSSLDTPDQYDSAGYNWLATQDTTFPVADRPGFVSWWDYGFQAIDQGQHPSVADNFQNGINPAGQFLLAQNESIAIGVLATTLLQAEQITSGNPNLPPALNAILAHDGLNVTLLHDYLTNTTVDHSNVVGNPGRYLPVDASTLTDDNAMFLVTSYFIADSQNLNGVAHIYNDIQSFTGWRIRYDMVDSRLIPFSGTDTGIFYAPADLTGRIINGAGLPTTYFNVTVLGSDGNYYPLGSVPASVSPINYYVNYFAPFYNSFIYRTYFGYNGTDAGQSVGIPGLTLPDLPLEPGWMLQHFQVVYRTAFYCSPGENASTSASCGVAMNLPSAVSLAAQTGGYANTSAYRFFSGGESMLQYYPGQTLVGQLQLPNGAAVGGARVTVFDGWGIPHQTVTTAPDGSFSLVLPPGNDTLNITTGPLQGLDQQGATVLKEIHMYVSPAVALAFDSPNLAMTFTLPASTVTGFVYWNIANGTSYNPATDTVVSGAQVVLWGSNNVSRIATTTDASGTFRLTNVPPGTYNYDILYHGFNYTQSPLTIQPPPAEQENSTVALAATVVRGVVASPGGAPVNGAVVSLSNPTGTVASNETNATGAYTLTGFAPGNYTLLASVLGTATRSEAIPVALTNPGGVVFENLTAQPTATASVTVTANGAPVAGIPVSFTPYAIFTNSSEAPIRLLESTTSNGSVAVTGSNGVATISLPYGNYSVTALGPVGATLFTGVGSLVASAYVPSPTLALPMAPAVRLSGTVTTSGELEPGGQTAVIAYTSTGIPVYAWGVNGSYAFYLPRGSYSLYALQGNNATTSVNYAALAAVNLVDSTSVPLTATYASPAGFRVGSPIGADQVFPAVGATVTISAGANGPTITLLAAPDGVALTYVPTVLPPPATSFCVAASAQGFVSASQCGYSPNSLISLTQFPLALRNVSVALRVLGTTAGTVRVNVTATSSSGVSRSFVGGPNFSFSLPPGTYEVSAWAPTGSGSTVLRSSSTLRTGIAVGATSAAWTVTLVTVRNSTGALTVPSGATVAAATVALSSPTYNLTVNGTAYTKGFYVAPGSYTAHATVPIGSITYSEVALVSVSAAGRVSPSLAIATPGAQLVGTLERGPNTALAVNTTAVLTGPGATTLDATVTAGQFSIELPADTTYSVAAAATTTEVGNAGAFAASWTTAAGASCTTTTNSTSCAVTMVPTPQTVRLNGTLSAIGVPGLVPGTVRFFGPAPSTAVTTVAATNGSFSVDLAPGVYSVYASGGGSSEPLAALGMVPVSLSAPGSVAIPLSPAWTATISVAPPSSGPALMGPANVSVTAPDGGSVVFAGLATNSPVLLSLPIGTYVARAESFGAPFGVASNATATMPVNIVSGNIGATLALSYQYTYLASASVSGANTALVSAPGTARFAFSMRATGNSPVDVHPIGSPSTWSFNFSFANATLVPGAAAIPATVTVGVPGGASALEPTVVVQLALPNGTVVGSFDVRVNVVPTYGVLVGSAGAPTMSLTSAEVPFFVRNTGNTVQNVVVSVVDSHQLAGLGWTAVFSGFAPTLNVSLSPFQNQTYDLTLTTIQTVFVAPGSVLIQASVTNHSGAFQSSAALPIPIASLWPHTANGSAPLTVTGPSVGSPPAATPVWLIPLLSFVPAIGLVVGVLTYRWWRTRRWTRR